MGFLIRCAFWLSLVLLVIPIDTGATKNDAPTVGPIQAFFAAREAVQDVAGICDRRPEVCTTGRAALQTIGARARESARMASEMIDEEPSASAKPTTASATTVAASEQSMVPDRSLTTGTIAIPSPRPQIH